MAKTIFDGVQRNFAATAQMRYKNAYKRRLMDRCILHDICNSNPENIKSFLGSGKGAEVELYIPGTVEIRDTQPDGGIVYQQVSDTTEKFGIARESYWALKFRPEDLSFMPWDPKSTYFTNATDMMARHIEKKFGADILTKVPAYNTGNGAGARYANFNLGDTTNPVALYKTQKQCDDVASTVQYRDVGADYIIKIANTLRQNEGCSGMHVSVIIPSPVKHLLQTSELKLGGIMGQRNLSLGGAERGGRAEVKFLGTMDDTVTVVYDDIMFRDAGIGKTAGGEQIYPIFAMMSDACAFIDDTVFRDSAMKDIQSWDEHYRAKQIYDWPVLFPQMLACGYVTLKDNPYTPA